MKKLGLVLVVLVLLLGAAVLIAPQFISPEMIKAQLTQRVETATGRKLSIEGKLALKLFPFIGVEAERVSLSNPEEGFDKEAFVSVGALQVNVALMPLLHQDIQVNSFVLKEPVIRLEVNKAGKKNWEFTPAEVEKGLETKPLDDKEAKAGFAPKNLSLSDIEISNGALYYLDATNNTAQKVEKLNAKIDLKNLNAPLDVKADAIWHGKKVDVALNLDSLGSFTAGKSSTFVAKLGSDVIAVDAKGNAQAQKISGKASVKSSSLKEVMAWVNPKAPLASPATLALDMSADVDCEGKACGLSNTVLALDGIKATGDVKLDVSGAVPSIGFKVKTGVLDVNPFLQAAKQASLGIIPDAQAAEGHWSDEPIDLSGLKAANVAGTMDAEGILFRQFRIGATALKLQLKQGALTAEVPNAALYDGKGSITLTANGAAVPATYGLNARLQDISLEALLKDAADMDRLSGKADITFNSQGRGRSQADIISSLAGSGKFNVANGKIQRVNLLDMVRNVSAAFAGANAGGQSTDFSAMGGSFTISQGVLTNNDLLIAMRGARVSGQGDVNLPAYTINYRLSPQTYSTKEDATGKAVTREGVQVPVLISGSLDGPQFQPDVKGVLTEALSDPSKFKEALKNTRGDLKEQIKQPKDAIKNIKGLLEGFKR